jgi:hypothetical protein
LVTTSRSGSTGSPLEHEVLHALRLEADAERQVARRQRQPVVRPVDPGRRVRFTAGALDQPIELAGRQLRGLAEHQVLEQVRHAGRARALVARADAEPGLQRDDRRAPIDRGDHLEPVIELVPPRRNTAIAGADQRFGLEVPRRRHRS